MEGLKATPVVADQLHKLPPLSVIRVAIILAVVGAGYFGYQHVAASSVSTHDRAVTYLTQQENGAAKLGHEQLSADSIT